jgi:hypothetical protein
MAPNDCVENTLAFSNSVAFKFLLKKVPNVTNHPPQIKNSRNIMKDSLNFIVDEIIKKNGVLQYY